MRVKTTMNLNVTLVLKFIKKKYMSNLLINSFKFFFAFSVTNLLFIFMIFFFGGEIANKKIMFYQFLNNLAVLGRVNIISFFLIHVLQKFLLEETNSSKNDRFLENFTKQPIFTHCLPDEFCKK